MYNDYYLQEISNKLTITNNNIEQIIENQETIKNNQQTLISGDMLIKEEQEATNVGIYAVASIMTIIMIYIFIERCLR